KHYCSAKPPGNVSNSYIVDFEYYRADYHADKEPAKAPNRSQDCFALRQSCPAWSLITCDHCHCFALQELSLAASWAHPNHLERAYPLRFPLVSIRTNPLGSRLYP